MGIEIEAKDNYTSIVSYAVVEAKDYIYFSDNEACALYKAKKTNLSEAIYVKSFPKSCLHQHAFLVGGSIWFLPSDAMEKRIDIFDMADESFKSVELPEDHLNKRYANYVETEDSVWIIPCRHKTILRVDKKSGAVQNGWELPGWAFNDRDINFGDAVIVNNNLYACPFEGDFAIIIDLLNGKCKKIDWKYGKLKYQKMVYYDNAVYYIPNHIGDFVLRQSVESDIIEPVLKINCIESDDWFCGTGDRDGVVWMMPNGGAKGVRIDLKNISQESIAFIDNKNGTDVMYNNGFYCYVPVKVNGGILFPTSMRISPWVFIDKEENISIIECKRNKKDFASILINAIEQNSESERQFDRIMYE